ncbi:inverse autotransporter beta domain-containing protein [Pragia fontium]|uniref:Ig-like domain (Group 1) n=1 Tax=Pragia fontium DSM 5563 = ATCC 49100 TaxID=1122977 RepID=A0AAJ5BHG1_9GAMM|nr:inverse autotransporter beta domain-containing protein [Pragia fontium]SFC94630.1 Ig-like domain (group 1) [Pragia fontium DSM 5563 = ATCC 49100]
MKGNKKHISYLLVVTQLALPVFPAYAGSDNNHNNNEQTIAQISSQFGSAMSAGNANEAAKSVLLNQASGVASENVESWLHQFGTAQISLQTDSDFSLKNSSADVLFPLYNSTENVLFAQLGVRDNDGRFTSNIGLGHRYFTASWMVGYNAFYDASWNNTNQRYGVGIEAWRDYLKLSANFYRGMSGWHQSRQHQDYDERPADGWDIRSETYLSAYPQLGAKFAYEQYYGDSVALFSHDDKQKNPHTFTVGVNYTPVPLITAGVDIKNGKNGVNNTQFNLELNYRLGETLTKQLDLQAVSIQRSLMGSRLDLVNRNNNIVMDYRKQELITLAFPTHIRGDENTQYTFIPRVKSKYGVERIELNDTALVRMGGKVVSNQQGAITLQLPPHTEIPVQLSGVAVDRHGNKSNLANVLITTLATQNKLALIANRNQVNADGQERVVYTLSVTDSQGKAVANADITWNHNLGEIQADGTTDDKGMATATLTSREAGQAIVVAKVNEQSVTNNTVTFTEFKMVIKSSITPERNQLTPNEKIQLTVQVNDAQGHPVSHAKVTHWQVKGVGMVNSQSVYTDNNGELNANYTATESGVAVVSVDITAPDDEANIVKASTSEIVVMKPLAIESIEAVDKNGGNENNISFSKSTGPTVAWKGAKFKVNVTNAVGNVTWTSDSNALSFAGDIITINNHPYTVLVIGKDTAGQTVAFTMNVRRWFMQSGITSDSYGGAQKNCEALGTNVSSKGAINNLFNQWGNFYVYDGWMREFYRTSTAYDLSKPVSDNNNWVFWAENGLWTKNAWSRLPYACGGE